MACRIAVFASGSGSNAENIIRNLRRDADFEFPIIISNRPDAYVHTRALDLHVPSVTFSRDEFLDGTRILELLHVCNVDCIVLAGFLVRMPDVILSAFSQRIINIHPALLPKFGGKGMYGRHVHEAVVASAETETGITIHYVDANYDEGAVIFQKTCPVLPGDTADDVAEKVHALEYQYYPEVIKQLWGTQK